MTEDKRLASYSDIYALGHHALAELFSGEVVIEEKIDGSQISFGRVGGELLMRSKGKQLTVLAPEKMFSKAVEAVTRVFDLLPEGLTFRGEYLQAPKHNTLAYARVPENHIALFDVDRGNQDYLSPQEKYQWANLLGFDVVPTLFVGELKAEAGLLEMLKAMLPNESLLGGGAPEGLVIKNYSRYAPDKKILMGKYVRPEFVETHAVEWKKSNPVATDVIDGLIQAYKTDARWEKAVQHLRDAGKLEQAPRDIAALLEEVEADLDKECQEEIKRQLWKWAWPKIARGVKAGLPEWYKGHLALLAEVPAGGR